MNKTNSTHRFWYWLTLVPVLFGASVSLLRYAGWSAIYSAYYGLPSEAWRLKEASFNAHLYGWVLTGLAATATILATMLIQHFKSESLPPGLQWTIRVTLATALVVASIFIITAGLSTAGHYLK